MAGKRKKTWWKEPKWWTAIGTCLGAFLLLLQTSQAAVLGNWLMDVFAGDILVRLIGLVCIVVPFFLWIRSNTKRMDELEGGLGKLETDKVNWNATNLDGLQSRVATLEKAMKGLKDKDM